MSSSNQALAAGVGTTRQGLLANLRSWLILPIILAGTFMITLDFFIVNVAIPSMQRDLHGGAASVQFVVAGYGLAYAAPLLIGGRLGDLYGRRRIFALGAALFTLASVACGLAPSMAVLTAMRVLQGLAAALLGPQVLAILGVTFTGESRIRAFTAYGLTLGLAAVFGQLIGGLLIEANLAGLGWRSCFLINLPVGAAVLVLIPRLVLESRAPGRPRLDIPGMLLVTLALLAVVLPLIEGRAQGWPVWTWLCLIATAPLFLAFVAYQHRLGARDGAPLIDLTLFRERAFTIGLIAQVVFWMGQASFFLVFALYVQQGRGLDALQGGLIFTPLGVGYLATSLVPRYLARQLGRQIVAVGALIMVTGLALLQATVAWVGVTGQIALLIPALLIDGAGMGMVIAPLASTILARVAPRHAGAASGVLSTAVQVGNALGVALIGIIFYTSLGRAGRPVAYPRAFNLSLIFLVAVEIAVAVLIQLLPRDRERV